MRRGTSKRGGGGGRGREEGKFVRVAGMGEGAELIRASIQGRRKLKAPKDLEASFLPRCRNVSLRLLQGTDRPAAMDLCLRGQWPAGCAEAFTEPVGTGCGGDVQGSDKLVGGHGGCGGERAPGLIPPAAAGGLPLFHRSWVELLGRGQKEGHVKPRVGRGSDGAGGGGGCARWGRSSGERPVRAGGGTACSGGLGLGVLEWVDGGGVAGVGKVVVLVHGPRGSAERADWVGDSGSAPR